MSGILVTGSSGMLGSHVSNLLEKRNLRVLPHNRNICDLTKLDAVKAMFSEYQPSTVVHCAALVGGIKANLEGQSLFYTRNLQIDLNVLQTAESFKVENLIYIGSSCMYPKDVLRPLRIEDLNSGPLEITNLDYALAKLAGSHYVSSVANTAGYAWRTFVSSNLYGPLDRFDATKSHLIASIILKIFQSQKMGKKEIEIWGDGTPKREFTYVVDFADWIADKVEELHSLPPIMNVGIGIDYSVREYYEMALRIMGVETNLVYADSLPNGTKRKLMDSSVARNFGWNPKTDIETGMKKTIDWFLNNVA